jgi:hypothetical protein
MEYSTIYEASHNQLITVPFMISVALEILLTVYAIVNWKHNSISGRTGMCIVGMFLFMIISVTIFKYCSTQSIWNDYKNDNYQIAEGIIENYEVGTDEKITFPDRFSIGSTEFIISNQPLSGYGYSLRQYDGGILCNGLRCTIYYIPYENENVIMKIMIFNE